MNYVAVNYLVPNNKPSELLVDINCSTTAKLFACMAFYVKQVVYSDTQSNITYAAAFQ